MGTTTEGIIVLSCLIGIPTIVFRLLLRQKLAVIIACALLAFVFLAILIPNLLPARTTSAQNACVSNLRLIQIAKARWAAIHRKGPSDLPTESDLFPETPGAEFSERTDHSSDAFKQMPLCPAGGTYILGAVSAEVKCSIGPPSHTSHSQ